MSVVQYSNLISAAKLTGVSVARLYRFTHFGDLEVHLKNGELDINVEDLMKQKYEIKDCEILEPTSMNYIL